MESMVVSLDDAKERLSEYVDRAGDGEDVLVAVDGEVKARLTAAPMSTLEERLAWRKRLERLHAEIGTGKFTESSQEILDQIREDRI